MNQAMTSEHFAAYKVHPSYCGEKLNDDQLKQATDYLIASSHTSTAAMIAFDAKAMPFPAFYFTEQGLQLSPVLWWQGVQRYNVSTDLANRAISLLSCLPSSASIEQVFSNFGAIHSKIRNRLGNEKAVKLVFCYRMLRGG